MDNQIILTGITTTGTPHIGNYVGAIRPAIAASRDPDSASFYFLADYHALIKCQAPEAMGRSTLEVAAAWLALGLDTETSVFYRQTDIPEIPELTWILTCVTAKGLMNRAHAYKAAVQENEDDRSGDPDKGITMGLYSYPILMAADILMFKATKSPLVKTRFSTSKWQETLPSVSTTCSVRPLFCRRRSRTRRPLCSPVWTAER